MVGLEDQMRSMCIRHCMSVDDDANVALARQRVYSLVRIARLLEDFLVFFHPFVHFAPFEGKMIFEARCLRQRSKVTPRRIFSALLTNLDRPVRCFTFKWALGFVLGRLK